MGDEVQGVQAIHIEPRIEHPGEQTPQIQQTKKSDHTYKILGRDVTISRKTALFAAGIVATLAFPPLGILVATVVIIGAGTSLYNSGLINEVADKVFSKHSRSEADFLNTHIKAFQPVVNTEKKVKVSQQWQNFKSRLFSGESAKTEKLIKQKETEISQAKEYGYSTHRLEEELEALKNEQAQIAAVQHIVTHHNVELNAGKDDETVVISELLFNKLGAITSLEIDGKQQTFHVAEKETVNEAFYNVGESEKPLRDLVAKYSAPRGNKTLIENLSPEAIRITHIKGDKSRIEFVITQKGDVQRFEAELLNQREDSPQFSSLLEFCGGDVRRAETLAPLVLPTLTGLPEQEVKVSLTRNKDNTIDITHKIPDGPFVSYKVKESDLAAGTLTRAWRTESIPVTFADRYGQTQSLHFTPTEFKNLSRLETLNLNYKEIPLSKIPLSESKPEERPRMIAAAIFDAYAFDLTIRELPDFESKELSELYQFHDSDDIAKQITRRLASIPVQNCTVKLLKNTCLFSAQNTQGKAVQIPGIVFKTEPVNLEEVQHRLNESFSNYPKATIETPPLEAPSDLPPAPRESVDNLDDY